MLNESVEQSEEGKELLSWKRIVMIEANVG